MSLKTLEEMEALRERSHQLTPRQLLKCADEALAEARATLFAVFLDYETFEKAGGVPSMARAASTYSQFAADMLIQLDNREAVKP